MERAYRYRRAVVAFKLHEIFSAGVRVCVWVIRYGARACSEVRRRRVAHLTKVPVTMVRARISPSLDKRCVYIGFFWQGEGKRDCCIFYFCNGLMVTGREIRIEKGCKRFTIFCTVGTRLGLHGIARLN